MSAHGQSTGKSTIIWNYIGTLCSMGIQFVLLPFLLFFLSKEELGVWYVMVSFSNISNLFSFGFTPAFARNVAYCWNGANRLKKMGKEDDAINSDEVNFRLLKKILTTSRLLYLLFAVIGTTIIGLWGTLHIGKIAEAILTPYIWAGWFGFLIAIFTNIYYRYYSSYLIGIGCVKENNQIIVFASVFRILVTVIFLFLGFGIFGAAMGYLANGIIQRILSKMSFYRANNLKHELRKLQNIKTTFVEIKECFSVVWYNAWRDGVVSVSEYLSTQISTVVCSSFLSLADTAMFSLMVQLVTAIGTIARSIHTAHTPVFQKAYITGDQNTLRETQAFCIFVYGIVYCSGIVVLIIVGLPVITFIKPDVFINRFMLFGYAIYQFMLFYRNCYATYMSNTNRVWYWKSFIITSFCVVIVYTALLKYISANVWWIIIISILGECAYNFWKWPRLVNKELSISSVDIIRLGYLQSKRLFMKG